MAAMAHVKPPQLLSPSMELSWNCMFSYSYSHHPCHNCTVLYQPSSTMESLPGKTELQRLEEERDAILACLAVCEAARIHVDQAFERNKDPQTSTEDCERVISNLSELIVAGRRQPNRQPQTNTTYSTGEIDTNTASLSQPSSLPRRRRKIQPQAKGPNGEEDTKESCGNSAADLQGDSHEESFVMVEKPDEGDPDRGL